MIIDPSVIRQVSREKDIDPEKMFAALEEAMSSAARKFYHDKAVVTAIDRKTGEMSVTSRRTVVEELDTESEEPPPQILLSEAEELVEQGGPRATSGCCARSRSPRARPPAKEEVGDVRLGDEIVQHREPIGLGRIAAQTAKQVLYQKVREAERDNIYNEFFPKVGELMSGTVKRFERGDMIVDLGKHRGGRPARPAVPRRALRPGRAHPRDPLRRPPQPEGAAAGPLADRPAPADPPLRDGSAGDLRRHGRHQGRRPPAGRARQGRGPLARARRGPGRRVRGHARQPRPVDHARAPRREDRRHPLLRRPDHVRAERARARQDHARLADPPRGRLDEPRLRGRGRPALARDRQEGTERPPRLGAHRPEDRDQGRDRGQGRGRRRR